MKYLDFKAHFEPFRIFSINDIKKWNEGFDTRRLVEWQQKGYLQKIINRWYIFSDVPVTERVRYLAANRIYAPSYISFESALAYHRLIPEGVFMITSATSLKTNSFNTSLGRFYYRHLKPELMFGYQLVEEQNQRLKMASPEKAILDYLYLNSDLISSESIEGLRINFMEVGELIDMGTLEKYLGLYKSKALDKRVGIFQQVVNHA